MMKLVLSLLLFVCTSFSIYSMILMEDLVSMKDTYNKKLLTAAAGGTLEEVDSALKKGADINAQDPKGSTALGIAIMRNHISIASLLLGKGASLGNALKRNTICPIYLGESYSYNSYVSERELVFFTYDKISSEMARLLYIYGAKVEPETSDLIAYEISQVFNPLTGLRRLYGLLTEDNACKVVVNEIHKSGLILDTSKLFAHDMLSFYILSADAEIFSGVDGNLDRLNNLLRTCSSEEKARALVLAAGRGKDIMVKVLLGARANPIPAYDVIIGILRRADLTLSEQLMYRAILNMLEKSVHVKVVTTLAQDSDQVSNPKSFIGILPSEMQDALLEFTKEAA